MNEPIERAQVVTGKVTARALLSLARKGSTLGIHGKAVYDRPSYSDAFTFECRSKERGKDFETTTELKVPGYVSNGNTSARETRKDLEGRPYMRYTDAFRPLKGFWYLYSVDRLRDLLELLPADSEVALWVYLDAGTNENLIRAEADMGYEKCAGMHADRLYLVAKTTIRGKVKTREFLIDSSTGWHNSARFGL